MPPQPQIESWYKHIWPWVLMTSLIFAVIASVSMLFVVKEHTIDLVSGDYYKDGKHVGIQLRRDGEAVKQQIQVQVLINSDMNTAKVFVSGQFDTKQPLNLLLMRLTYKADGQIIELCAVAAEPQGGRMEYEAVFKPLCPTNHWYLHVEGAPGVWRVENRWIVNQGNAASLTPMDKLFDNGKQIAPVEQ